MENVVTLLEVIAGFIGIGTLAGVLIGKYLVKRAKSKRPPVLTLRQRIIYGSSILVGIAAILLGVFYPFPTAGGASMNGGDVSFAEEATLGGEADAVVEEAAAIAVAKVRT